MKQRKVSAFTLIELLVVIAIIAILAAILFPVFAQAKLAAKATASLSNTKQLNLGVLMYANDVDDQAPLLWATNEGSSAPLGFFGGCAPWSWVVTPYTKNGQIFLDPLKGDDNTFSAQGASWGFTSSSLWDETFTEFGYDSALLDGQTHSAPSGEANPQYVSKSMTSLSRPADFVMLTEAANWTDPGYNFWVYGMITNMDGIEGPYCFNGCSDLWGGEWYQGSDYGTITEGTAGLNEGADTGGVAWRKGGYPNGLTNVSFCDGHSKSMTPGGLAVGTNWNPTIQYGQVQLVGDYQDTFHWYQY